jgi:hypothetical protein
MALLYCTKCGHQISSLAPVCPACGSPQTRRSYAAAVSQRRSGKRAFLALGGIITIISLGVFGFVVVSRYRSHVGSASAVPESTPVASSPSPASTRREETTPPSGATVAPPGEPAALNTAEPVSKSRWFLIQPPGFPYASSYSEPIWKWDVKRIFWDRDTCVALSARNGECVAADDPHWGKYRPQWLILSLKRNEGIWEGNRSREVAGAFSDEADCTARAGQPPDFMPEQVPIPQCVRIDDPRFSSEPVTWILLRRPDLAGPDLPISQWTKVHEFDSEYDCRTSGTSFIPVNARNSVACVPSSDPGLMPTSR